MSYQDLEAGFVPRRGDLANGVQDPSHAVAAGVFQINTAVTTFMRLTNQLGTVKDTPELRQKLQKTSQHIMQLIKDTSAKLKDVNDTNHTKAVSATKKVGDAKLAKDFRTVLELFEKAQRAAAEREATFSTIIQQDVSADGFTPVSPDFERRSLLAEQRRQEYIQLDNEVTFNEAVIEERAQGIREIHESIEEVHEIFKDLAVLVNEQGKTVEDIDTHIENTFSSTVQANRQLNKASKHQKSGNYLSCMLLMIFGAALVVIIIVLAA